MAEIADIVIIGAGPASSSVLLNLNQAYDIRVIDYRDMPRNKTCGGILIEESNEFLKQYKMPDEVYAKPKVLDLKYEDWDNKISNVEKRDFRNVYRDKFDNFLLKEGLKKSGAVLEKGTVKGVVKKNAKYSIKFMQGQELKEINAKIIIDGSGAACFLNKDKKIYTYSGIQFVINQKIIDENLFVYVLCNQITDYYAWIIPKSDRTLIGLAIETSKINERLGIFKKMIKERFRIDLYGDKAIIEGAPILKPMQIDQNMLVKDGCLIIGEAAGLISPSTGEGISYALRSGKLCANAINENFPKTKTADEYVKTCRQLVEEIKQKIERSKLFSNPEIRKKFFLKQKETISK